MSCFWERNCRPALTKQLVSPMSCSWLFESRVQKKKKKKNMKFLLKTEAHQVSMLIGNEGIVPLSLFPFNSLQARVQSCKRDADTRSSTYNLFKIVN